MSHWPAAFPHRCICGVAGGCVQGLTYLQPGFWCHSASVYDNCRLQTADCRPQSADCKLKDTKNLPNKGDTIINITSCESEKVDWEQGWYFCAKLHGPHFQDAVGYSSPTRLFIDSAGISLIALILYSCLIIVNW